MSVRIETAHNPYVKVTTIADLDAEYGYDHDLDEANDPVLLIHYDELVVISGDLEKFHDDVRKAVDEHKARVESGHYEAKKSDDEDDER